MADANPVKQDTKPAPKPAKADTKDPGYKTAFGNTRIDR